MVYDMICGVIRRDARAAERHGQMISQRGDGNVERALVDGHQVGDSDAKVRWPPYPGRNVALG